MAFGDNRSFPSQVVEMGKASHMGLVRSVNEDSLVCLELFLGEGVEGISVGLYAVADGIGGYEAGEVASDLALRVLTERVINSLVMPALKGEAEKLNREFAVQVLRDGVIAANGEVYRQGKADGTGMGTTLVVVLRIGSASCIANVGDSRAYLLREGKIRQVTTDHSLVAALVAGGVIAPEEIYTHSQRNIITRYVGAGQSPGVDLFVEELKRGDCLLLCSDGLWEMVRDSDMEKIVAGAETPQLACEQLVQLANRNGGVDNVTVIVVRSG